LFPRENFFPKSEKYYTLEPGVFVDSNSVPIMAE
jgi:hypothetical protein